MKSPLSSHYSEAIAFALETPAGIFRELYTPGLYLCTHREPTGRPQFTDKVYLEAFEKVPGGIVFLNWWAPVTRPAVRDFFAALATSRVEHVSPRPYRLGQSCDGTTSSPVFHAFRVACDALGLDADDLHRRAYPEEGDAPPDWPGRQRHAEWQGGVEWPERWDATAVARLADSLTEINNHRLRDEFETAANALFEKT
ncbi:hypothetical protein OH491_24865 [Termitidicoccus mucosus]|uniref:Uncharacterized protein n=1 Tax=Termitidicoccus mucosus TaxID=1184151 RepID=A0A178IQR9_9BACT|nr:hypothetical protein AW736_01665 [Opitutaceae bacterium TSB47]